MTGSRGEGQLVAALAAGASVRDAARQAGVSERTAYRRLEEPAFRRQVADARAEFLERAVGRLAASATEAADTLRGLLVATSEPVRHSAAKTILEVVAKSVELLDLMARIEALEERVHMHGDEET
jgi:hypothetical protein